MNERARENLSEEIETRVTRGDAFLRQYDQDQKDITHEDDEILAAMRKNVHRGKELKNERIIFHRYVR